MDKSCCSGGKNNWMMILFVVLMAGFMFLRFSGVDVGLGSYMPFLIFLICPLMHIGMMVFMFKGKKKEQTESIEIEQN